MSDTDTPTDGSPTDDPVDPPITVDRSAPVDPIDPIDPLDPDFADLAASEDDTWAWADFDPAALAHPMVLRSLVGVVVALTVLVWPQRSDNIAAILIGLGAVAFGLLTGWDALRQRPIDRLRAGVALALVVGGGLLLAAPLSEASTLLGRALGTAALLVAARHVIEGIQHPGGQRAWSLALASLTGGVGALLVLFPQTMLTAAVVAAGLAWAALGAVAIAMSLDRRTPGAASYDDAGQLVVDWLESRPKSADDRQQLYQKILYDGPTAPKRIGRFFSLMTFAAIIASTGVIGDSTAVVIGAMLIAPLMTPLMGMAISLVMGWPRRLARSTLIAGAGILLAITVGLLVGLFSPTPIDTSTNAQILSRISPTILDLLVATAAGAAGAYGLSRPDVSDSLPGVAIAISLVPPLTVVGISYSQGDLTAGAGALLLFTTNMVAILIMGGLVFIVTGVTPISRLAENQNRTRTSLAAVGGLAALVVGALLLNGAQAAEDVANEGAASAAVEAWLADHPGHDLVEVGIAGDEVTAVIIGPADGAPTADALAVELADRFDRSMAAQVRLVVEERDTARAEPPG